MPVLTVNVIENIAGPAMLANNEHIDENSCKLTMVCDDRIVDDSVTLGGSSKCDPITKYMKLYSKGQRKYFCTDFVWQQHKEDI